MFAPGAVLEIFARGSIVYLALFFILRIIPNRQVGAVGLTDLLFVVLVANALQNAIAKDYTSITDGFILVGTIVFWSYTLNWLGYKSERFRRWLRAESPSLVEDGKPVAENLRRQLITEDELMSHLRLQGVDDLAEVKQARIEADGRISVVERDDAKHTARGAPDRGVS